MATSLTEFQLGLYSEHLDEASFLYTQCLAMRKNDEHGWMELHGFEQRLEAHLDALVVGGEPALARCVALLEDGDPGVLHAALGVFCRQRRSDLFALVLKRMDHGDPLQRAALTEALRSELPDDWSVYVERALAGGDARLTDALATAAGQQRLPLALALQQALLRKRSVAVVTALGRLRASGAHDALVACTAAITDPSLQSAALLSLLQIGATDALQPQYLNARLEKWPRSLLALGGSPAATVVLCEVVQSGKATPECLLALGLLGDRNAMRTLFQCMQVPECAQAAALALNWASGAQLYEQQFKPDDMREDELTATELLAWREQRQPPMRLDGKPFGRQVQRLSTDPEVWHRWLAEHREQFTQDLRYRLGQPYSPQALCDSLLDARSDRRLRRFAALEMGVRYGCDVAFEPDWTVQRQWEALQEMQGWVDAQGARFTPGAWYANGQAQ